VEGAAQTSGWGSRVFALPRAGGSLDEYEDAWAGDDTAGVYAVADGAGESAFAGLWARALVGRAVQRLPPTGDAAAWAAWLEPAQAEWQAAIHATPLPWYVAAKARAGAFATLVSLHLQAGAAGGPGQWAAVAVGDSCLFHIPRPVAGRADVRSFPLHAPADFTARPYALSSNPACNAAAWAQIVVTSGVWQPGDRFLLATDAVAQWLLRAVAPAHWAVFLAWLETADDAAFPRLVAGQRGCGALRDDDVTLLLIRTGQ
jgi:hypothetical protein